MSQRDSFKTLKASPAGKFPPREMVYRDEDVIACAGQYAKVNEILNEATAVCICGCAIADHENNGEDGEQCEHEDHQCFRTSRAALDVVQRLRRQLLDEGVEDAKGKAQ